MSTPSPDLETLAREADEVSAGLLPGQGPAVELRGVSWSADRSLRYVETQILQRAVTLIRDLRQALQEQRELTESLERERNCNREQAEQQIARLTEARDDADGRYRACYAELTKVQEQNAWLRAKADHWMTEAQRLLDAGASQERPTAGPPHAQDGFGHCLPWCKACRTDGPPTPGATKETP